jgi:hypothetical protein
VATVFSRLWARAPIWRRAWYATGAALALTIAFPPPWLGGTAPPSQPDRPLAPQAPLPQGPAAADQASPTLAPDAGTSPAPTPAAGIPVAGNIYSGRLPLGAQSVPLPLGRWVTVAVSSAGIDPAGDPPSASAFLALVLGGRIAAIAIISGSTSPDKGSAGFTPPLNLEIPAFYYRRVIAAADHGALDLWLCGHAQPAHWTDPLSQAAARAIRQDNLALPDHFASVVFRMADTKNWISANFMYPDPAPTGDTVRPWTEVAALPDTAPLSHLEKVRRWGKQWHEIMRRGFSGTLRPGDEAHIDPP